MIPIDIMKSGKNSPASATLKLQQQREWIIDKVVID